MVSYGDVRKWRPGPLDGAEKRLKALSDKLLGLSDEFADMGTPGGWSGDAAEAAGGKRTQVADRMEQIVAGVAAARAGLADASDGIIGLNHGVQEADGLAKANGFDIGADGSVKDVAPPQDVPEEQADDVRRERQRIKAELVDRVEQILRKATDIDNDLSGVLGKIAGGAIDTSGATDLASAATAGDAAGQLSVLEPPPGKGTPGDNAGWWDSLSKAEQQAVIKNHPEWIGNRDGVPFTDRDAANRTRLETEKARTTDEEHAKSIEAIESALAKPGERQLLLLDFSDERTEAAIANGNVDTADHVAVFTPGLTSNVPDSMGRYDANMDQLQQRAKDELDRYGDGGSVATVTWIGYQAPQNSLGSYLGEDSVLFDDAARTGGEKLTPFLQGIDTARDADAHLTAMGHSYGSSTTGFALQENTGVDEAVFFGSPGVGTGQIEDLQVPAGHSTYIEAKNDFVGDLGAFGIDPTHMDGMQQGESGEARHPGDGRVLAGVEGHSAYLQDGSTSQYNMSVIVGGMSDRVIHGDTSGIGDIGSWPIPGTY